ncbi:MAG: HAMP domain-containing histidine kinase [Verrucomicrobia bacterium]|nr:HAMP domain-containing histidine kinase [Verrucomicrobiota bacterium]
MKKVALVFVLAVLLPSLILAWLAVRSLRDQHLVFERQQSLLYQGVTDSLARQVETRLGEQQHEFVLQVEQMLSQRSAAEIAPAFDERLRADWPAAKVGFVVTTDGEILSPSAAGRPEARRFRGDNDKFLAGSESAEIYLNYKQAQSVSATATRPADSVSDRSKSLSEVQRSYQNSPYTKRSQMTPATRNVAPKNEWTANNQALDAPVVPQAQFSKLAPAEGEFQRLISSANEGALARFVDDKLSVLLWYRAPRDPRYVFGAQLDLTRLKDELRDILPGVEPALREDICIAIIDDRARPVALSHPDFKADWKHPFVATEIGEILPHWEIAAYLLNPEKIDQAAGTAKLVLGLFIGVLVLAISVGSWLVASDVSRQLTLARQKTDFVSNVSHELKTPLTSIRMFSELLAEDRVAEPEKQRSYLNIITAETARLTRLINNVLDFARMDRGEKKYTMADCDLAVIARETAETFRPHLESAAFKFEVLLPESSVPVRADRDAISQVIVNLLSNAEKYSNGVKEIRLEVAELPPATVELRVMDRGPGVARGCEEKIFEQFYRADDSLNSGVQGSGLGLTLARQIARAHGGEVVYEPREDGGSCFTLRLPVTHQTT